MNGVLLKLGAKIAVKTNNMTNSILYKKISSLRIEMSHENGEEVAVVFVRPDKMKNLLKDNEFLMALAEKLDNKEL